MKMRRRRSGRGLTLIECMVALSILGIGVSLFLGSMQQYQLATRRGWAVEGLARVLDVELERLRACGDRACVDGLLTRTATTAGVSREAGSWVGARVARTARPGPDGTIEVTLSAVAEGVPEQRVVGLVRVHR